MKLSSSSKQGRHPSSDSTLHGAVPGSMGIKAPSDLPGTNEADCPGREQNRTCRLC